MGGGVGVIEPMVAELDQGVGAAGAEGAVVVGSGAVGQVVEGGADGVRLRAFQGEPTVVLPVASRPHRQLAVGVCGAGLGGDQVGVQLGGEAAPGAPGLGWGADARVGEQVGVDGRGGGPVQAVGGVGDRDGVVPGPVPGVEGCGGGGEPFAERDGGVEANSGLAGADVGGGGQLFASELVGTGGGVAQRVGGKELGSDRGEPRQLPVAGGDRGEQGTVAHLLRR